MAGERTAVEARLRAGYGDRGGQALAAAAVIQLQRSAGNQAATHFLQRDGPVEVDLVPVSPAERERLAAQGVQLPAVSPGTAVSLGAAPYQTVLPGYSQAGDTCGAASLVTALLIWDREHWDPRQPNRRAVAAAQLVQAAFETQSAAAVARWSARPSPEVRRLSGGDGDAIRATYRTLASTFASELAGLRAGAAVPGAPVREVDYQLLGLSLYFLWHEGGEPGLTSAQIRGLQDTLGLATNTSSGGQQRLTDFLVDPVVTGLQPDQMAQIVWFTRDCQQHAFLIGRLQTGEWFLSDQGQSPPFQPRGDSVASLRSTVLLAMDTRTSWLHPGTTRDIMNQTGVLPGTVGVTRLGSNADTESKARDLILPDAFLGEVDAGTFTIGDRLTRGPFAGRADALAAGQALVSGGPGSGVVIERPAGLFTSYRASAVSSANLTQTGFDASDSSGGALVTRRFQHAWLQLGTSDGRKAPWLSLY